MKNVFVDKDEEMEREEEEEDRREQGDISLKLEHIKADSVAFLGLYQAVSQGIIPLVYH